MSREHKFRGMDLEGNWHIGNLAILPEDVRHLKKGYYISNEAGLPFAYQVRPETVGQYIGRADDKGKDLFEGQRVKFTNLSLGRFSKDEQWAEGVIAYSEESSVFYISQGKDSGWNLRESSVLVLDDEGEAAKA
ncbi:MULTISPECIES: hypothetical protein [Paenibacillus]|jgi:hypothetical protein|uniref:YopX protein domain-containing protein n=1 Tax=Paenibacillus odorifer TaxID=189426 RepID=A0ABX3GD90_9BACL|nr:hypothetical protein [Paenibacillus odorifer]OMC93725.1 hypothetical protein BSO21_34200 [Paenibacillus odorifer]OME07889.1 hypothetical protein BSK64_06440 [Paenibacillus odorifer]